MDFSLTTLLGVSSDASFWSNLGSVTLRSLIVLLGVNMLVIVHEWGHFIVARMCGVRCEKFYIWFDAYGIKLFSFKRGDTEYGLGWLPLGGYVKMFGQEDNPGGIQAEIDRAKLEKEEKGDSLSEEEKKKQDEQIDALEKQLYAPDSYLSKNVFQRMAIISAGVFMNVVFAIVCATGAALIGTPETSTRIGYVAPASPAWEAGLQDGDRITGINDDKQPIFSSILVACMDRKPIKFEVVKAGSEEPSEITITPRAEKGGLTPMIGVGPAASLDLAETKDNRPFIISFDKTEAENTTAKLGVLKGGERLISMNDQPVNSPVDYARLSRKFIDKPIRYVFAPTYAKRGGERFIDESKDTISVSLDPVRAPDIGVRLTMGEIIDIRQGSAAEKSGLRARQVDETGEITQRGDVILEVDNSPILDPLAFPYQLFQMTSKEPFAVQGIANDSISRSIILTVNRDGKRVDISLSLPNYASYSGNSSSRGAISCDTLGVAYEVLPIVSGSDGTTSFEESPLGGQIVKFVTSIPNPGVNAPLETQELFKSLTKKSVKSVPEGDSVAIETVIDDKGKDAAELSSEVLNWFSYTLPHVPNGAPVSVFVKKDDCSEVEIKTRVKPSEDYFVTARGFYFGVDAVFQRADSLGSALAFGWSKTLESAGQVIVFLRNVGKNVSAKALGGPGTIIGTAYAAAGRNDGIFLLFLCLISANLAVVNFLPIPVLDGGHMVFLLYEAVTRRKPNEKLQVALSWVGFVLILALMFWVIFLDVVRYCF